MKTTDIQNSSLEGSDITRDVIATYPEEMAGRALKMMAESGIHHLPVLEGERIVGLVSYKDLFGTLLKEGSLRDFQFVPVARIMRRDVLVVNEGTEIREVLHEMRVKKLGALPVVRDGKLSGIVTESDMLRVLEKLVGGEKQETRLVEKGESLLANPLVQRVVYQLSEMGI